MKRRSFLKIAGVTSGVISLGPLAMTRTLEYVGDKKSLTILHTNDVHSRIDPFPSDAGSYANRGGSERRAALIRGIRNQEKNVLLFDSGDMWQGTPYFNKYGGELEFKLMSHMKYDAATIGNHDFDAGLDGLERQLPHAQFEILSSNYDWKGTILEDRFKPYKIIEKDGIRVGVIGVGIELEGLVPPELYGETKYLDPIEITNHYAAMLANEKKCDLVVCLSHLGYDYDSRKICDTKLAEGTENVDIILGGHTHTFMKAPDIRRNLAGESVLIHQVGWAGLILGRLNIEFEISRKSYCINCDNQWIK